MKIDKDNTGLLFPNDKKETDRHPNLKGVALIGGVEFWVSAWVNLDKNQKKYLSLKFQLNEGQQSKVQKQLDTDDDIPF